MIHGDDLIGSTASVIASTFSTTVTMRTVKATRTARIQVKRTGRRIRRTTLNGLTTIRRPDLETLLRSTDQVFRTGIVMDIVPGSAKTENQNAAAKVAAFYFQTTGAIHKLTKRHETVYHRYRH